MRKKIVAGNWKMNTTVPEGIELAKAVVKGSAEVPADVKLVIATPFTHLFPIAEIVKGTPVGLSAENCADKEKGAYTGEISAAMLETDEKLVEKTKLALEHGLDVILCVGENLEEREAGKHFDVCASQIKNVLYNFTAEDMAHIIVAYEPVWAIGTGKTATAEQAEEIHAFIRKTIAEKFGEQVAEDTSILYGGSCKPSNAKELFAQKDIDGGLIGGAALKAEDFIGIALSY